MLFQEFLKNLKWQNKTKKFSTTSELELEPLGVSTQLSYKNPKLKTQPHVDPVKVDIPVCPRSGRYESVSKLSGRGQWWAGGCPTVLQFLQHKHLSLSMLVYEHRGLLVITSSKI